MNCSVKIWDPDPSRARQLAAEVQGSVADSFSAGLASSPPIVFICSPPVFHVEQAVQAIRSGAHMFVEKPLSHSFQGISELAREAAVARRTVQVGYNMRFLPAIQKIKEIATDGTLGRVLWMAAEFGQYLPDWRPQQDYRLNYTARRDLGGGIILDASHELDYVLWILGRPSKVIAMAGRNGSLEVDVEDCATVLMNFPGPAQADVHLDFLRRDYTRGCRIVGETGSIEWKFGGPVRHYDANKKEWFDVAAPTDFTRTYYDEAKHFLSCVQEGSRPISDIESASMTLEVALAAKSACA